ncbi:hypothetical protein ACFP3Q_13725 [Nocardioides sp. GCM10027113]|uniref:hypothetical protein n=1 Tax=unclassified Nocardioides TaxID=2615069 RepID=UPI0036223359
MAAWTFGALSFLLPVAVVAGSPAHAVEYGPSWTKLTQIKDPCGKWNPMRSGYWDTEAKRGWGWYKMHFKHELSKWDVWETTVDTTCGQQDAGSTTWVYHATFVLEACGSSGCETIDKTTVRSVVQRKIMREARKGMITTYCIDREPCPVWLNDYQRATTGAPVLGQQVRSRPATSAEISNDVVQDSTEYANVDDQGLIPVVDVPWLGEGAP